MHANRQRRSRIASTEPRLGHHIDLTNLNDQARRSRGFVHALKARHEPAPRQLLPLERPLDGHFRPGAVLFLA